MIVRVNNRYLIGDDLRITFCQPLIDSDYEYILEIVVDSPREASTIKPETVTISGVKNIGEDGKYQEKDFQAGFHTVMRTAIETNSNYLDINSIADKIWFHSPIKDDSYFG